MNNNNINLDFIERYQKILEKDPNSKVYAPLGEAYRKMGMQKEALDILKNGVNKHPNFASGRVALAKVYMDQKQFDFAAKELNSAIESSAENLLAYRLIAECYLQLRSTKNALKAFKMVLFLNPHDAQAQMHVKKLESLTADEYDDEVFEMKPLRAEMATLRGAQKNTKNDTPLTATHKERQLERVLSLTDAFITRFDLERALETIQSTENQIGKHPELEKRKSFIQSRINAANEDAQTSSALPQNAQIASQRIDFLKNLLDKIESRRKV